MNDVDELAAEILSGAHGGVVKVLQDNELLRDENEAIREAVRTFLQGPGTRESRERLAELAGVWSALPLPDEPAA